MSGGNTGDVEEGLKTQREEGGVGTWVGGRGVRSLGARAGIKGGEGKERAGPTDMIDSQMSGVAQKEAETDADPEESTRGRGP